MSIRTKNANPITTPVFSFSRFISICKVHLLLKKQEKKHVKFQMMVSKSQESANAIKWIEKGILEHPFSDQRKYIIWRILSPYLLNVKKLPKEEVYSVMKEWLDKCDNSEKLNFNANIKIKDGLKGAGKGYPISMEKKTDCCIMWF
jgi:hypothetical protein